MLGIGNEVDSTTPSTGENDSIWQQIVCSRASFGVEMLMTL